MKTLNCVKTLLLLVALIGFSSCGDTYYTDDYIRNSDEKLCSKDWVEEYDTNNNELCRHSLIFGMNGTKKTGKEMFEYFPKDNRKPYTNSFTFTWSWIGESMEGLILDFGPNDLTYFDNVWVREHYLSGQLDGVAVVLTDSK